ncbi:hypothetical protein [Xenorhabdus doucetiae]|uniref:Uncharacterized protein n=1 Tax=Xenorhabdus doucetiae TaxID=351671 RepID=A0A068QTI4_9GAMM|nr:hypothetical protein [Xenorhabdus doucetiae]TYO92742.1 hypothetical protein LY16_03679 [Xenorhabdus doucetiae]CDG17155.1 protein of unknown function [Xenorhabdus doucetiae]
MSDFSDFSDYSDDDSYRPVIHYFFKFNQAKYIERLIKELEKNDRAVTDSDRAGLCSGITFYILGNILRHGFFLGRKDIEINSKTQNPFRFSTISSGFQNIYAVFNLAKTYAEKINKTGELIQFYWWKKNKNNINQLHEVTSKRLFGESKMKNGSEEGYALLHIRIPQEDGEKAPKEGWLSESRSAYLERDRSGKHNANHLGFVYWNNKIAFVFDPNVGGRLVFLPDSYSSLSDEFIALAIENAINAMLILDNDFNFIKIVYIYKPNLSTFQFISDYGYLA